MDGRLGSSERVSVSQYRLAVHLTLAGIIFASIMWLRAAWPRTRRPRRGLIRAAMAGLLAILVLVQIYLGALGGRSSMPASPTTPAAEDGRYAA